MTQPTPADLEPHIAQIERRYAVEAAHRADRARNLWSGMHDTTPLVKPQGRDLIAAATDSWRREEAARNSDRVRLLSEVHAALRTLETLSGELEDVLSAINRETDGDRIVNPDAVARCMARAAINARLVYPQVRDAWVTLDRMS